MIINVDGKSYEGKFNFHSIKYANEYLRRQAVEEETTEQMVVGIYSRFIISHDPMDARLLLEFMYAPKSNGGLSTKKLDQVMDDYNDDDRYDELVEEIITEVEKSGFFKKQIRNWYQATEKLMEEATKEGRVRTPEEDLEISMLLGLLEDAREKNLI